MINLLWVEFRSQFGRKVEIVRARGCQKLPDLAEALLLSS
jgi:hypothetical protein